MTTEADGAFKRAPSSFRNFIQAGGEFPPERGTWCSCTPLISLSIVVDAHMRYAIQIAIIFMCPTRAVRLQANTSSSRDVR